MRRLTLLWFAVPLLAACATTSDDQSPYAQPNKLMGEEIRSRIAQIQFQHREELFYNLLWLTQAGEPAIPALLEATRHPEPKVRSNAAWVLAQIGDRRVIPDLQPMVRDTNGTVRLEAARALVLLGDMQHAPVLIEALDADQPQVRFLCHEALKTATNQDFGYDHLTDDMTRRHRAVHSWRAWWSSMSGDGDFARQYAAKHGIEADAKSLPPASGREGQPAAPLDESRPRAGSAAEVMKGHAATPSDDGISVTPALPVPETSAPPQSKGSQGEEETIESLPPANTPRRDALGAGRVDRR